MPVKKWIVYGQGYIGQAWCNLYRNTKQGKFHRQTIFKELYIDILRLKITDILHTSTMKIYYFKLKRPAITITITLLDHSKVFLQPLKTTQMFNTYTLPPAPLPCKNSCLKILLKLYKCSQTTVQFSQVNAICMSQLMVSLLSTQILRIKETSTILTSRLEGVVEDVEELFQRMLYPFLLVLIQEDL